MRLSVRILFNIRVPELCRTEKNRTTDSEMTFTAPMTTNIARAFRWQALIDSGKFSNVHELARAIGKDDGYVSRIIRLTLLSPEIIHAIIAGTLEKDIGIKQLKQEFIDKHFY